MTIKRSTRRPFQQVKGDITQNFNKVGNNFAERRRYAQLKETQKMEVPPPSTLKKIVDWFLGPKIPKDIGAFQGCDKFVSGSNRHPLKNIERVDDPPICSNGPVDEYLDYLDKFLITQK